MKAIRSAEARPGMWGVEERHKDFFLMVSSMIFVLGDETKEALNQWIREKHGLGGALGGMGSLIWDFDQKHPDASDEDKNALLADVTCAFLEDQLTRFEEETE